MGNAWVSPSISHSTGKCNKTHCNMEKLGNWCSYFSHIMDAFFPLDSHFMVCFITWEMHVFSHQFPIAWEKAAKPIEWGKSGKLVPRNILQNPLYVENLGNWYSYFSHSMGAFFPLDSHSMSYFIICDIHGFTHQFPMWSHYFSYFFLKFRFSWFSCVLVVCISSNKVSSVSCGIGLSFKSRHLELFCNIVIQLSPPRVFYGQEIHLATIQNNESSCPAVNCCFQSFN